jgi:Inner membrane component of T3SS, cytoplasmic domain
MFDLIVSVLKGQDSRGAMKKIINGVVGGGLGGIIGGILAVLLQQVWTHLFATKPPKNLYSPSAWGFVALGLFIGLLISLAQVIMKEAWLRVEAGFRQGRELIVNKDEITIGRGEGCDVGLFGDSAVEKLHARLLHRGDQYLLEDVGTVSGTYVNDARIRGQHPLRSGDVIRLGKCLLRFGERAKRD